MRWLSHAHSIDEIESRAGPDLGPAEPPDRPSEGEAPGRHIAARTSVMNLVVVARQPEVGERARRDHPAADRPPPVADADRPVGGPGRPAVARRADPGALRAAPRGRARDVHRADLPDRRRRDRPAPVRARRAAAGARPAGDRVVARRAAARPRARARPARGHRPPRRRRLGLVRRRAATACTSWPALYDALRAAGDPRLRAGPPVALARGDRVGVRPARTSRRSSARSGGSPSPTATHDETGAPGTTNVVKPLYHVAWLASRLGLRVTVPLAPVELKGTAAPRGCGPATRRRSTAGSRAGCRGVGGEVAVVMRPIASPMPAGHDAAGRDPRRAARLASSAPTSPPRPRTSTSTPGSTASRRSTARSRRRAGPRSTCWARRSRPAGATRSPSTRSARRPSSSGPSTDRPVPLSEAATDAHRSRPARAARPARRRRRGRGGRDRDRRRASRAAIAERGVAHWSTTGGSAAPRDLPPPRDVAAAGAGRLVAGPRVVGRRPVRPARPPASPTSCRSSRSCS